MTNYFIVPGLGNCGPEHWQKVLEKWGFVKIGTDRGFANARQKEIEEYIYTN